MESLDLFVRIFTFIYYMLSIEYFGYCIVEVNVAYTVPTTL